MTNLTRLPNINDSNVTNIADIITYVNTVTNGLYIPVTLLTLWAIVFGIMYYFNKTYSMIASTFLIFLVSVPFWAAGLLPAWYTVLLLLLTLIGVAFAVYGQTKSQ